MKRFLIRRWFLLALVGLFVVGVTQSAWLSPLAENTFLRPGVLATVLFLMALPLEASAVGRSFRRPTAPLLACFVNLGILPLFAWGVAAFVRDPMLRGGLLVAAVTPCTLASASVWTRKAGGDDSVSLLVSVGTNLICFVVSPLWLTWMTQKAGVGREIGPVILKLGLLVVLPMAAAQIVRLYKPVARFAAAQKISLSTAAQCGILTMVLIGAVRTGERLRNQADNPTLVDFGSMLLAVMLVHVAMFGLGIVLGKRCGLPRPQWIAVAFSGSQKTLMVGLHLSIQYGFSILPMITYHIGQLLIDTLFADHLKKKE